MWLYWRIVPGMTAVSLHTPCVVIHCTITHRNLNNTIAVHMSLIMRNSAY